VEIIGNAFWRALLYLIRFKLHKKKGGRVLRVLAYTDDGQPLAQWHLTEGGVRVYPSPIAAAACLEALAGVLSATGWTCRPPIKPSPLALPEKKEAAAITQDF